MPSPPEPRPARPPMQEAPGFLAAEESRRLLMTAHLALKRGNIAEAERMAVDAAARLPEDPAAYEMLGDVRLAQNQFDAAAAAYREALQREPSRTTAEAKLARASLRQSETQRKNLLGIAYASESRSLVQGRGEQNRGSQTRLALLSAVLPGLGQIVVGEFAKGAALLAVYALGCLMLTYTGIRPPLGFASIAAFAILIGDWIYAVADAARSTTA